jgi:hypothetical protein
MTLTQSGCNAKPACRLASRRTIFRARRRSFAVDAETKLPLRKLELQTEAGRILHFDNIHIAREPFVLNPGKKPDCRMKKRQFSPPR